jgi:hypothetical protein
LYQYISNEKDSSLIVIKKQIGLIRKAIIALVTKAAKFNKRQEVSLN